MAPLIPYDPQLREIFSTLQENYPSLNSCRMLDRWGIKAYTKDIEFCVAIFLVWQYNCHARQRDVASAVRKGRVPTGGVWEQLGNLPTLSTP